MTEPLHQLVVAQRMGLVLASDKGDDVRLGRREFQGPSHQHAGPCAVEITVHAVVHHVDDRTARRPAVDLNRHVIPVQLEKFEVKKFAADVKPLNERLPHAPQWFGDAAADIKEGVLALRILD